MNDASDRDSSSAFPGCVVGRLCKFGFDRQFHAPEHDAKFDHDASACIGTGTRVNACTDTAAEVITR
ncbi:hypothetical protein [Solilutibacter silvestris]|uniref:hypothetical protein n=1 Tax=Solilutibacter silvestris TaxID=1645665 RepID=UPI003D32F829